jgi:hypothetical protein
MISADIPIKLQTITIEDGSGSDKAKYILAITDIKKIDCLGNS